MNTPSRREFFTYAAAATLASALPAPAQTKTDQTKKDTTVLPLVVDMIGPMALRWSGGKFELWMPDLSSEKSIKAGITPHQAGIMTTETSIELKDTGDYEISGPSSSSASATMYPTSGAKVYETQVKNTPAPNKYNIYVSLPKPRCILVLDPVWARIYPTGSPPPSTYDLYAVGVRLFYDKAGVPTLRYPDKHLQTIPSYVAPCETQTNMQIGYAPYDTRDPEHADSKKAFHQVSLLWGLDLQVEFESKQITQPVSALTMVPYMGPYHDCKCPVIGGSGGS